MDEYIFFSNLEFKENQLYCLATQGADKELLFSDVVGYKISLNMIKSKINWYSAVFKVTFIIEGKEQQTYYMYYKTVKIILDYLRNNFKYLSDSNKSLDNFVIADFGEMVLLSSIKEINFGWRKIENTDAFSLALIISTVNNQTHYISMETECCSDIALIELYKNIAIRKSIQETEFTIETSLPWFNLTLSFVASFATFIFLFINLNVSLFLSVISIIIFILLFLIGYGNMLMLRKYLNLYLNGKTKYKDEKRYLLFGAGIILFTILMLFISFIWGVL